MLVSCCGLFAWFSDDPAVVASLEDAFDESVELHNIHSAQMLDGSRTGKGGASSASVLSWAFKCDVAHTLPPQSSHTLRSKQSHLKLQCVSLQSRTRNTESRAQLCVRRPGRDMPTLVLCNLSDSGVNMMRLDTVLHTGCTLVIYGNTPVYLSALYRSNVTEDFVMHAKEGVVLESDSSAATIGQSCVETDDLKVGNSTSEVASTGDTVTFWMHAQLQDGTTIDRRWPEEDTPGLKTSQKSSLKSKPFDAKLGSSSFAKGGLVAGLDAGIRGMRVGGDRLITVPPEMGFGAQGEPPRIPPHATLIFRVRLLSCVKAGVEQQKPSKRPKHM